MDPEDNDRTIMVGAAGAAAEPPPPAASLGHNALQVGTKIGEFEVNGLVGEGGFGIVYLAYDHSLERTVALKEYMPSELAQREGGTTVIVRSKRHAETFAAGLRSFINEARLLAQFDHPSLVKVYRFWEANGTAYMVMPFYEGITLKEQLRKLGGAPDEGWLKVFLAQLLDALEIIHNRQCYHRDIAPDNVLILPDETPLLLDFGAARRVIGDMTQALTVILKPGYAPIEQYAEVPNMKQGPWTDLYALASVVYFAITGQAPVPAVARVMSDPLVPLAQSAAGRYSDTFLRGIDKALSLRPEDRPQNIAEFRESLGLAPREATTRLIRSAAEAVPASLPPSSAGARPAPTQPAQPSSNRNKLLIIAGASLGVLVLVGLVLYVLFDEPLPSVAPEVKQAATPTATPATGQTLPETAAAVTSKLAAFDCALLQASVNSGTASIQGHVASEADAQRLRNEVAAVNGVQKVDDSAVSVIPKPYCAVVSAVAPFAAEGAAAPTITLKGGGTTVFEGGKLAVEVVAPDFDGYVYADLYEPEGNVVHLLPNPKDKKFQLKAGQRLVLGDDPLFGRQWDVVPPFGKHMLVVMASRTPLFERQRPEVEEIAGYLKAVRDSAGAKGGNTGFVARYVPIEFAARK